MDANNFVPIRVSTLRGENAITFDAYVRVAGKFILYCRKGDTFEGQRLKRLKEKKLKKMFILQDHEGNYRSYLTSNIEQAYDKNSGKSIEDRSQVIQGAQQAAAEDVMENPESQEFYQVAKIGAGKYVDFILKEAEAVKSILAIENTDASVGHHGVTVGAVAVAIAEQLGMSDRYPMDLLTMGCLLHDFDHMTNGLSVGRSKKDMTTDEIRIFNEHPRAAVEKVKNLKHFDNLVLKIILQHEECIDGSGVPNGLKEKDVEPLAVLCATANSYDKYVSFMKLEPKEALKTMLVDKMGLHPLSHLQALQAVLKEKKVLA